jgi:D-alanyl-D-alanine carboxypeptidase
MWIQSRVHNRLRRCIFAFLILGAGSGLAAAAEFNTRAAVPIHLPYPIAHTVALTEIDGQLLARSAADAFVTMQRTARQEGVHIVLRSGYRSHSRQSWLFYGVAAARGITLAERARVSAPPGYSEHHTGYALDLDDGQDPRPLRQSFERTRAGKWLFANAHRFCFEMSFPRDNHQGISYEPWHWRYVGSTHASRTFAEAHAQYPRDAERTGYAGGYAMGAEAPGQNCTGQPRETARAEGNACGNHPSCPARTDRVADASHHANSAQR